MVFNYRKNPGTLMILHQLSQYLKSKNQRQQQQYICVYIISEIHHIFSLIQTKIILHIATFFPLSTNHLNHLFHALKTAHKAQRKEEQKSPDCSWVDSNSIGGWNT